jgi:hypothetical protein
MSLFFIKCLLTLSLRFLIVERFDKVSQIFIILVVGPLILRSLCQIDMLDSLSHYLVKRFLPIFN